MKTIDVPTTTHRMLAARARGVTHTLVLAMLVLAIGLAGLGPSAATAHVEMSEQAESTEQTSGTEQSEPVPAPPIVVQPSPGDVQLRVGETATLEGGALLVSMVQVAEDSRCPMDVMCVWMGRAVVVLHVVLDGVDRGDVTVTLYPGPQGQHGQRSPDLDATVGRYVIALADLQPYPVASQPQPLDQRVATIRVTTATP
jgi:hypothetical protein